MVIFANVYGTLRCHYTYVRSGTHILDYTSLGFWQMAIVLELDVSTREGMHAKVWIQIFILYIRELFEYSEWWPNSEMAYILYIWTPFT